jgi:hypothetical protein
VSRGRPGVPKSPETRAKMAEARKRAWAAKTPEERAEYARNISLGKGGTGEPERRMVRTPDGRKIFSYRYDLEVALGRILSPDEKVHHIDGDPTNNELDNLQVVSQSAHIGLHQPHTGVWKSCPNCGKNFYAKPCKSHVKTCSTWCGAQVRWGRAPNPRRDG